MSDPHDHGGAADSVSWELRGPDGELKASSDDVQGETSEPEENGDDDENRP